MNNFFTNIQGKVNNTNLPVTNSLMPLFETIINAIQSIEETGDISKGYIEIYAKRENEQVGMDGNIAETRFVSFRVTDNGLGFNNENYKSFRTSDSLFKQDKGCKGVGRFLWLKAFDNIKIESVYYENGKCFKREFDFNLEGIVPENNVKEISETKTKTTVDLIDFKYIYSKNTSLHLESVAEKIIEHFLTYFISEKCPKIVLKDSLDEEICLNSFFNDEIKSTLHKDKITIYGKCFELFHLKLSKASSAHKLHFCANGREVKSVELKKYINNLQKKIKTSTNNEYWYFGYIVGEYLDEIVNSERTGFAFPNDESSFLTGEFITEKNIIDSSIDYVELYLSEELKFIDEIKHKEIDEFINNKKPQYRSLIKYKHDLYDDIPAGLSNGKLEVELHKQLVKWENDVSKQGEKLFDKSSKIDNIDEFKERFQKYCKQISALGQTSLAEYIVRRKAILDLLNNAISYNDERQDYNLESKVHSIICPMRYTSEELDYEDMNLWIIDEKLSYHYYLASDKPLRTLPTLESKSRKELDLVVFNNALSFTSDDRPYSSITIIEFKKPMRNDYNENENPISQIFQYIDDIRVGKAKDKDGRPFGTSNILNSMPIYCYIISDLTDKMTKYSRNAQLRPTPDQEGFFGYDTERKAYIEVISYNKLIDDATKRNQVLFDKLFNPKISDKILKEDSVI
jgi:hypothetical protein